MLQNLILSSYIKDYDVFTNFDALFYKILLPLTIVIIIASFIGFERQNIGRAAGVSSHVLVAIAATGIAILQRLIFDWQITQAMNGLDSRPESQRLVAQVISGIGFLGAGVILKDHDNIIRGLTTAATIWTVALVGIILGSGYIFLGSTIGIIVALFILIRDFQRGINPFIPIELQKGFKVITDEDVSQ